MITDKDRLLMLMIRDQYPPRAIRKAIGVTRTPYNERIRKLVGLGLLVRKSELSNAAHLTRAGHSRIENYYIGQMKDDIWLAELKVNANDDELELAA